MTEFAWVLEDVRCRKWSRAPIYLHADFYSKITGPFTDEDYDKARRFKSWEEAERFMADHGLSENFAAVEHGWISR